MSRVTVSIDGKTFDKWKSITINRTIGSICGTFSMTAFYDYKSNEKPFTLSGKTVITYEGTTVMTGYIDGVNTSIGNNGMNVEISGRDVTCDIIDCSIGNDKEKTEFLKIPVLDIILKLIEDYNLFLISTADDAKILKEMDKKQSPDEKVSDVIIAICKKVGILPLTSEKGALLLEDKAEGAMGSGLKLGNGGNILEANHQSSHVERYKKITVLDNNSNETQDLSVSGGSSAVDGVVLNEDQSMGSRNRVLTTISENQSAAVPDDLEKEANWKMAMSRASLSKISAKVQGWKTIGGELWKINRTVDCDLSFLGLPKSTMLIKSLTFDISESGSFTNFELIHEDAYEDKTFTTDDSEKTDAILSA
jgi:prophage tail gpP-like protein